MPTDRDRLLRRREPLPPLRVRYGGVVPGPFGPAGPLGPSGPTGPVGPMGPGVPAQNTIGFSEGVALGLAALWFVNILDFGAVCDSSTDFSLPLQKAFDYCGTTPGAPKTIYCPIGASGNYYNFTRPTFCPYPGIRLIGDVVAGGGNSSTILSRTLFGQKAFAESFPWIVNTGNNNTGSGGTGGDGPIITQRTYPGGTAPISFARLNPSLDTQLDLSGIHLADTDLGDWQGVAAFSISFFFCLLTDVITQQTGLFVMTSSGSVSVANNGMFHSTLRLSIDNVGTNGVSGQNGLQLQLQTANTQNGNGFTGGVTAKSTPGAVVVGQVHHGRIVYDGGANTVGGNTTLTQSSTGGTFQTPTSLAAGQPLIFSSQPGVVYTSAGATTNSTAFTLASAYGGPSTTTATTATNNLTISIDGSPNGTRQACTGALQQQWYEQARIGGEAAGFLTAAAQKANIVGTKPNIDLDLASIEFVNYALPTTFTPPNAPQAFRARSGSQCTIFNVDFANKQFALATPYADLSKAVQGFFVAQSSWHGDVGFPNRSPLGSPVVLRWRGKTGTAYIQGMTFANIQCGGQSDNGSPPCQHPLLFISALNGRLDRCVFEGNCGPMWDVFSYQWTLDHCQWQMNGIAAYWARAWGAQFAKGCQYMRVINAGVGSGTFGFISASGGTWCGGFLNGTQQAIIAAGTDAQPVNLESCHVLDDSGNTPTLAGVLCIDAPLTVTGGYQNIVAGRGVPMFALMGVSRASFKGSFSTVRADTGAIAVWDSLPVDIDIDGDVFGQAPTTNPAVAGLTWGDPQQGAAGKTCRIAAPGYDCSAGGAIAVAPHDVYAGRIVLFGTPSAGFQVQIPALWQGLEIRFTNLTGQTATVYAQAPAWAASSRYGGHAIMTPTTPNGRWYMANRNNSQLAAFAAAQLGAPALQFAYESAQGAYSSGTSGAVEPAWSTTTGGMTGDGQTPTNPTGVVGCFWFCMGAVGGSSTRQAGNSFTVAAGASVLAYSTGFSWTT